MSKTDPVKLRMLDFSACKYYGEIYQAIKAGLELPEWCGENLDALWDSLTGIMYVPAEITIKKCKRKNLLKTVEEIIDVFKRAEEAYHEITVKVKE